MASLTWMCDYNPKGCTLSMRTRFHVITCLYFPSKSSLHQDGALFQWPMTPIAGFGVFHGKSQSKIAEGYPHGLETTIPLRIPRESQNAGRSGQNVRIDQGVLHQVGATWNLRSFRTKGCPEPIHWNRRCTLYIYRPIYKHIYIYTHENKYIYIYINMIHMYYIYIYTYIIYTYIYIFIHILYRSIVPECGLVSIFQICTHMLCRAFPEMYNKLQLISYWVYLQWSQNVAYFSDIYNT